MILGGSLFVPTASFSASVAPSILGENVAATSGSSAVSAVVTPSGGLAPYTYSWTEEVTGGDGDIGCASPTAATTQFTWSGLSFIGATHESTFKCTVTDALSQTTFINLSVIFFRDS